MYGFTVWVLSKTNGLTGPTHHNFHNITDMDADGEYVVLSSSFHEDQEVVYCACEIRELVMIPAMQVARAF